MKDHEVYMKGFSIIDRYAHMYHLRALKEFNISGHQMGYIMYVCKEPGISQEKIAAYLKLDKGAVAKGIRPLIEDGFIDRIQSEKDKRAYELYPTEKAKALKATAKEVSASFETLLTKGMTEEEKKQFKYLIEKATENVLAAAGDNKDRLAKAPHGPMHHEHCHHNHKERGF